MPVVSTLKDLHFHKIVFPSTHFQNLIFDKILSFKISFLTKFTISKSHFWQNSQLQNHIFDKIHIFKITFFTKFTFSKSHFWQKSHFQNLIFDKIHIFQTSNSREFLDKKLVFAPVCKKLPMISIWTFSILKSSIGPTLFTYPWCEIQWKGSFHGIIINGKLGT